MSQPQMPHIPGMTDTLDFVKNLWGSMGVPGLTAPTLSVEELDKKINDLKAVESWLNLNMSMLRGSIQALEVQRGTIATLKSVGASLASAVQQGHSDRSIFDANPYASAFFHHAQAAAAKPEPVKPAQPAAQPAPPPAAESKADNKADSKPDAPPLANPAIWWNLLQEQFKQAVSTAMASEAAMADAAARATDTAVKFATAAAGGKAAKAETAPAPEPKADTGPKETVQPATKPPAKAASASGPSRASTRPASKRTPAARKPQD
ncbi:PhaM family polyhydroxyalkanoate granule multifunctional regulatory protein [Oxalobacteraceae bacterium A2-2]